MSGPARTTQPDESSLPGDTMVPCRYVFRSVSVLLACARERSGLGPDELALRFLKLTEWGQGDRLPTLRQRDGFDRATHTRSGFCSCPSRPRSACRSPITAPWATWTYADPPGPVRHDLPVRAAPRVVPRLCVAEPGKRVGLVGLLNTSAPVVDTASTTRAKLHFEVED